MTQRTPPFSPMASTQPKFSPDVNGEIALPSLNPTVAVVKCGLKKRGDKAKP